ncbi:MAG TPA: efflux RND transporter permease subunit, partial [Thermoanaerobaculia bacterium]|nr:efflux RND transporter permease subunit [Thermoanaerobaculia bacterium]
IIVENVERHLHLGETPFQAAIRAARELRGPIIAMTITLAAVYAPIGIQGGLTGALFREFAFTLAGAVIISGVVALTLSPMMGSKLLRSGDTERGFAGWVNRRFEGVRRTYGRLLTGTLAYRPVVFVLWGIVVLLIVPFYLFSQRELAPKEDQSVVFGIVQAAPNATIDQTKLFATQVHDTYRSFPEAESIFQITSPSGGFGGMVTKPWSQRKKTTEQLQVEAAAKVSQLPGVRVISLIPPSLPGGGDFPVDFVIASTAEPERLTEFANQLVGKAFASGLFMFADSDLKFDQPQAEVVFDRDKVRAQGVDLSQAGRDLSTMLGGDYVNRFSIQGRSYKVIPQVKRTERLTPQQLEQIYVKGAGDKLVPLSTFATLKTTTEPRELKRFQQLNAVRIQGVIPPGVSLDKALRFLEDEAKKSLPKGFTVDYAGESRQLRTEGGKFLGTFLLSAILIYLVLAAQFESFRDPFIILAGSVPLALSGSLLFSFLGFTTLNIYSQVGLITLVGLVAKNGILIVEFANNLQEEGKNKLDAVIEAATTRLRPILMTTAATVMGHFPLVFATGPGAGARNSIGMMLVTGMIIGTAFTLFVVPSIYVLVARTRQAETPAGAGEPEAEVPELEAAV